MTAPRSTSALAVASFVNAFGNGAYVTVSVLFLTRSAGLSPAAMAIGLGLGSGAGVLLTTPLGYLADRYGPKRILILGFVVLAVAYSGLLAVRSLATFVPLACLIAVAEASTKGANGALAAGSVPPAGRLRLRARLRSVINAGIGLGALAGSVPLLVHSRGAYAVVLLGNAASFLLAAAILLRVAPVAPREPPPGQPRLVALRDRPFVVFALLDGLVGSLYNNLTPIGLPLWLTARTHAPLWLISAALVVNTAGCVLLQVRAARGVDSATTGARYARRGALVVALSCVLYGATGGLPSVLVGALVLVAATVHVIGELWMSTGSWAIVFGISPDWAQGQYQGTYFAGRQIGDTVSPLLITACVAGTAGTHGLGLFGWPALALVFVLCAFAYRPIVRAAG